jgi:hypothetical protein
MGKALKPGKNQRWRKKPSDLKDSPFFVAPPANGGMVQGS